MNVKPKFVYYDIRRKQSVGLIMYTHENDVDTQVLEVSMLDNGEPIELDTNYTYSAAIVNRDTKALINDNISCELNDSGNVLIPIDNFHTLGAQDLLIELTITDSADNQVLAIPFPLWIHVNASILDDAQVTPESEGTVPELLEEAKEALENAGDYENLENKPQINGHELVGDKSSDDLGLQGKLTAGENITIDENGEISATGGVTSYTELADKPQINGHELVGNKTSAELGLQGELNAGSNIEIDGNSINYIPDSGVGINVHYRGSNGNSYYSADTKNLMNKYTVPQGGFYDGCIFGLVVEPNYFDTYKLPTQESCFLIQDYKFFYSEHKEHMFRLGITADTGQIYISHYSRNKGSGITFTGSWKLINPTISSVNVNQNGTITFTMSDGSTVTTTGESVIGPQGPAGADGNNYVLTAQDKSDIAAIVLSELPTTQGVQYGNSND